MSRDDLTSLQGSGERSVVEVVPPLRPSHAWVAFACQKAGLTRPRWDVAREVWTTRGVTNAREKSAATPAITISVPRAGALRVSADSGGSVGRELARRFVSAILVEMNRRKR